MRVALVEGPAGREFALRFGVDYYAVAALAKALGRQDEVRLLTDWQAVCTLDGPAHSFLQELHQSFLANREDLPAPLEPGSFTFLPVVGPDRQLFLLAGNYLEHVKEGESILALKAAEQQKFYRPRVFSKHPGVCGIGHGMPVQIPVNARQPDYEGELLVVIGKEARHISPDEAMQHVHGYSIINDVSERAFRSGAEESEHPFDKFFDWLNGKWADGYAASGPDLVSADEVPDPYALELSTEVDGELRQRASTGDMIFDVARVVSFISTICTLRPGDAIATGTPSGVGSASGRFLEPGQTVTVRISGVGELSNPVQSATQ